MSLLGNLALYEFRNGHAKVLSLCVTYAPRK